MLEENKLRKAGTYVTATYKSNTAVDGAVLFYPMTLSEMRKYFYMLILHDHAKYAAQVELWRTRGPMHQLIRSWEATNTFPHGLNVNTLKRKYAFTEEVSSSAVCSSEQPLGAHCEKIKAYEGPKELSQKGSKI